MDTDDVWNGFFGGSFESIAKRMEKMFSDMENLGGTGVKTYGYTVYTDSDGNRQVREFGNAVDGQDAQRGPAGGPLMDISLEEGVVRVIVEIPGTAKEDIALECTKNTLSVSADAGQKRFAETLALPCDVDPDSVRSEYNNGILEVVLARAASPDTEGRIENE